MRTRWVVLALASMFFGALGGVILSPQPAGAVSKEMVQLQLQVSQLLQGQQDMRNAIDANNASTKTLIQQALDASNKLNAQMGALEQSVQQVQANTGSRIDGMTQLTQGLSDNLQDVQSRVAKLSQQLNDIQGTLQSIDSKVSNTAPPTTTAGPGAAGTAPGTDGATDAPAAGATPGMRPTAAMPPISADTLYQNALRDFTTGNYALSRQEFGDYIKNFPSNDLAGNAQFYLGEIDYAQGKFSDAIGQYETVLSNYPQSFKLAASLLKKGMAEIEIGKKSAGIRDLRDVVRRYPGSDEERRAAAKLHEMGVSSRPSR